MNPANLSLAEIVEQAKHLTPRRVRLHTTGAKRTRAWPWRDHLALVMDGGPVPDWGYTLCGREGELSPVGQKGLGTAICGKCEAVVAAKARREKKRERGRK